MAGPKMGVHAAEPSVAIAFASRFGTTRLLVERVASGLRSTGFDVELLDVTQDPRPPPDGRLIVMSSIIWESSLPAMNAWIARYQSAVRTRTVAAGVVCGRAGVEANGGLAYTRALVKRIGAGGHFEFALSGGMPARERLRAWERSALAAAGAVLGHSFTHLRADEEGASMIGLEL